MAPSAACTFALGYLARGWFVFPCGQDKQPLTTHGFLDASDDHDTVRAWWRRWPEAEIGIATGKSCLCVIDLDVDKEKRKDGIEAFEAYCGSNPHGCALIARTPRRGRHLYYLDLDGAHGPGADVANMRGIDVRAGGSYVIAPSGRPDREWLEESDDLTSPPEHLLPLLPPRRGPHGPRGKGRMSPSGTANDDRLAEVQSALAAIPPSVGRTTWLTCIWAVHAALDADERGAEIVEQWSSQTEVQGQYVEGEAFGAYSTAVLPWNCPPGRELIEAATLFHHAKEHGWQGWTAADRANAELAAAVAAQPVVKPSTVQAPPSTDDAFPLRLIEGNDILSVVVSDIVTTAPVPQPALALGTALAVFGAMLGRRVQAVCGAGPTTRTNLYVLGVGSTSSGKNWPRTRSSDLMVRAGMSDRIGPREFMSGSAVYTTLQTHPSHVALIDEFGIVLRASTEERAPAYLRGIVTALLTLYSSAASVVEGAAYADQRLNPMRPLNEPCLCIAGFSTPETLAASLSTRNVADGLLGRFLLFRADESQRKRRGMFRADAPQRATGDDVVSRLVDLRKAIATELPDVGGPTDDRCRKLTWAPDAAAYFDDILLPLEEQRRQERHGGIWARLVEHVTRVALIRAVTCDPAATTIGVAPVEWAHTLVSWCLQSMHRLVVEHVADNQVEADSQRLVHIVRAAGRISHSELTRKSQWLTRCARKELIASLVEGEQLRAETLQPERDDGKGKPKTIYSVPPR